MKILTIAWRSWSAACRYKSLMVNAKEQGHEVMCVVSGHIYDSDLTMIALQEIGVVGARGNADIIMGKMNEFDADAVFGEYYWSVAEEGWAQAWAIGKGKPHFLLDHSQYSGVYVHPPPARWNDSHFLVVNMNAAEGARAKGWSQVHVVGQPDLDLIDRRQDIGEIRARLRCAEGQPLVALFLEHISGSGSPPGRSLEHEAMNMNMFMDLANKRGWRVVAHCHGQERQTINGLYHGQRVSFLKQLQDRGVTFVAGWAPGTVHPGVKFERCDPFELIMAADAVTGSTATAAFMSYPCGKRFLLFYPEQYFGVSPTSIGRHVFRQARQLPGFDDVGKDFHKLITAVEEGKGKVRRSAVATERWFHKLDGKCWKRMLDLAEVYR